MAKKKKNFDFQEECKKILEQNMEQVPVWLEKLGREDPEAAIKMLVNLAEFVHSKKAREGGHMSIPNINILMVPAKKKRLEAPTDNYIDITPED